MRCGQHLLNSLETQLVSLDLVTKGEWKVEQKMEFLFCFWLNLLFVPAEGSIQELTAQFFSPWAAGSISSSDVNGEVQGCRRCWRPSGQVGKSTWGPRGFGGCLRRLGPDLCRTNREVPNTYLCQELSEELHQSPPYSHCWQCQWQGDYWGAQSSLKIY